MLRTGNFARLPVPLVALQPSRKIISLSASVHVSDLPKSNSAFTSAIASTIRYNHILQRHDLWQGDGRCDCDCPGPGIVTQTDGATMSADLRQRLPDSAGRI